MPALPHFSSHSEAYDYLYSLVPSIEPGSDCSDRRIELERMFAAFEECLSQPDTDWQYTPFHFVTMMLGVRSCVSIIWEWQYKMAASLMKIEDRLAMAAICFAHIPEPPVDVFDLDHLFFMFRAERTAWAPIFAYRELFWTEDLPDYHIALRRDYEEYRARAAVRDKEVPNFPDEFFWKYIDQDYSIRDDS